MRTLLHRYMPTNFHDPFGLFIRLIRSKDWAAFFAMETALLGILLSPFDLLLRTMEKRRYETASHPVLPLIFVCGPPRSGTTLLTQVLIDNLPVSYINNLTAVFSRSPITATLLFQRFLKKKNVPYKSFYGKSVYFSGPNDALYIWDRWFGSDRSRVPTRLGPEQQEAMRRFFGAYQQAFPKPLVNKNNNLNTYASLVADVFENAHFLCLTRNPVYLAQSLLRARLDIHGNPASPYGLAPPQRSVEPGKDYIQDVCEQALYLQKKTDEQQQLIGADRFWKVSYEKFCNEPASLVKQVSEQILQQPVEFEMLKSKLKPFQSTNRVRIEPALFEAIEQTINQFKVMHDSQSS